MRSRRSTADGKCFQRLSVSPESSRTRKCDSFLTPQSEVRCARGGGLPPSPVAPPLGRLPPFFAQKSVSSWGSVDAANSQATVDPPSCSVVVMSAPGSPPNCFGDGPPTRAGDVRLRPMSARPTRATMNIGRTKKPLDRVVNRWSDNSSELVGRSRRRMFCTHSWPESLADSIRLVVPS